MSAKMILLATAFLAMPFVAHARTSNGFDGTWAVSAVASPGSCSDHYSFTIRVAKGRISYAGMLAGYGSGRLGANGQISLRVGKASAAGTLSKTRGSGSWRSARCAGTWVAAKA
jgi:hypothetical protein